MQRRSQAVWVMACAVILTQVSSAFRCDACEQACCRWAEPKNSSAGQDREGFAISAVAAVSNSNPSGCPRCAARQPASDQGGHGVQATHETRDTAPCRCQWEARHDLAGVPVGRPLQQFDGPGHALAHAAFSPDAILAGLPAREWIATAATIPARPARILYGVWRN